jgi:predicted Fe-Mo cluster-binding NifX family protein
MKAAVCYDNGQIFQHFGHTEQFKIYTIENGKVVSSELINTDGTGHEALADFLKVRGVTSLVCGGIGGGAVAALSASGLSIYAGNTGDADTAAEKLARGALVPNAQANCSHHDHQECGDDKPVFHRIG